MKPINPTTHGYLDYGIGALLLASPWLLGFNELSYMATMTMVALGVIVLALSIITDYPLGLLKAVPFRIHGILETAGALGLVASPWLFGYTEASNATIFAVAIGLVYLAVIAMTNYVERYSRV